MERTEKLSSAQLPRAAELLNAGHLVAFPTETVYGLGAQIFLPEAIQKIYRTKGRPSDNPLIAHVSSLEQIDQIAQEIPKIFYDLAEAFFPGPLTVVLKKRPTVPAIVSAGLSSIAVRMPSHPIALKLISLVNAPLVAPSANLSGKPSSTRFEHVWEDFEGKISAVVDGGPTEIGIESTVVSLLGETPVLLRPGLISLAEIQRVLGCPISTVNAVLNEPVLSPGMKYRHYCPTTPIHLFHSFEALRSHLSNNLPDKRRMLLAKDPLPFPNLDHFPLSARDFYSLLRQADRDGYDEIIILSDEEIRRESGLMNRILRASGHF